MTDTRAYKTVADKSRVAILYIRLSDIRDANVDETGVERTFELREQAMRERVAQWGWTVGRVIRENDLNTRNGRMRGVSAFKRKRIVLPNGEVTYRVVRKGFKDLLNALKSGEGNAAVCEDLDRIMRDPYDNEDLMQLAKLYKIHIRSMSGSLELTDGGTDSERYAARILVAGAAKSSEDTARRVAEGRRRKAQRGEFGGGLRPFGFRVIDRKLVPDPVESAIIADFSRRLVRETPPSMAGLAAELRERDVPTVNGGHWNAQTLRQMLLRPRNAGIEVYQGEEIGPASHPAIVPEPVFRQVVRVLTDPARRKNPGGIGRGPCWLGSGLYRCGTCDGPLYVAKSGGRRPRYVCKRGNHVGRLVDHVDAVVTSALFAYIGEQRAWPARVVRVAGPTTDLGQLHAERDAARRKLDALAEDYAADLIDRAQMRAGTERARLRLAELDAAIAEHFAAESAASALVAAEDVETAWEALPLGEQRGVLAELLSVTLHPAGRVGRGAIPPEALVIRLRGSDAPDVTRTDHPGGKVAGAA